MFNIKSIDMLAIKTGSAPNVKVGDKVVVGSSIAYDITVKSVTRLPDTRTEIVLDWGQHGTSKVYLHDHGKTWKFKTEVN
jgi:alanine racemase